jgi:hypothetical protein
MTNALSRIGGLDLGDDILLVVAPQSLHIAVSLSGLFGANGIDSSQSADASYSRQSAPPLGFFREAAWPRSGPAKDGQIWQVFLSPFGQPIIIIRDPQHDRFRLKFFHFIGEGTIFFGAHAPIASIVP